MPLEDPISIRPPDEKYLFIGGTLDGQRLASDPNRTEIQALAGDGTVHSYGKIRIGTGIHGEDLFVYKHSVMTDFQLLQRLVKGYQRKPMHLLRQESRRRFQRQLNDRFDAASYGAFESTPSRTFGAPYLAEAWREVEAAQQLRDVNQQAPSPQRPGAVPFPENEPYPELQDTIHEAMARWMEIGQAYLGASMMEGPQAASNADSVLTENALTQMLQQPMEVTCPLLDSQASPEPERISSQESSCDTTGSNE